MRKVYVDVSVRLILLADDDVDIGEAISALECTIDGSNVSVEDSEVIGHAITDSK